MINLVRLYSINLDEFKGKEIIDSEDNEGKEEEEAATKEGLKVICFGEFIY